VIATKPRASRAVPVRSRWVVPVRISAVSAKPSKTANARIAPPPTAACRRAWGSMAAPRIALRASSSMARGASNACRSSHRRSRRAAAAVPIAGRKGYCAKHRPTAALESAPDFASKLERLPDEAGSSVLNCLSGIWRGSVSVSASANPRWR
jgi:hypothetical protein